MKSNDFFLYHAESKTWATDFIDSLAFVSCSTEINPCEMTLEQMKIDKPVYLAVMASRKQLQPILDNPHLFDPAFVNAVKLLAIQYEDLKIE